MDFLDVSSTQAIPQVFSSPTPLPTNHPDPSLDLLMTNSAGNGDLSYQTSDLTLPDSSATLNATSQGTLPQLFNSPSPSSTATSDSLLGTQAITGLSVEAQLASQGTAQTLRINVGGNTYTDTQGNEWQADQDFTGGRTYRTRDAIAQTEDDLIYQTERFGDFSYAIPVTDGNYDLNLHLAEIYFTNPDRRIFDITAEGQLLQDNLDLFDQVGDDTAYQLNFDNISVTDGVLDLQFTSEVNNAKLAGLELIEGTEILDPGDDNHQPEVPSPPSSPSQRGPVLVHLPFENEQPADVLIQGSNSNLALTKEMANEGDGSLKVWTTSGGQEGKRAEIYYARHVYQPKLGDDIWSGFSTYVPEGVKSGGIIWQENNSAWKYRREEGWTTDGNGHMGNDIARGDNEYTLQVADWDTSGTPHMSTRTYKWPVSRGQWEHWVIRFKPSTNNDGILQVWKDGVLVADDKGANQMEGNDINTLKMGLYGGRAKAGRLTYIDNVRLALNSDYNTVAPEGAPAQRDS